MTDPRPAAPADRVLFEAGEAAGVVGGACSGYLGAGIRSVTVDSRTVAPGSLFVALPGERVDGHGYIAAALAAGASCVFAETARADAARSAFAASGRSGRACLVIVDNCLGALQDLAREHRRRMPRLFRIGVTGSSGKTTTKECIAAALSGGRPRADLIVNPGNLNSDIGLAVSLFGVEPGHRVGVFEMGMNRVGEMDELARMYEPDLALVTNVGNAHIGIIGSRDGIAAEKKMVFSRFDGSQTAFIWDADDYGEFLARGVRGKVLKFGLDSTRGLESVADAGLAGWKIRWKGLDLAFPLVGRHNLLDGLAALSVADETGVDAGTAVAGLSSVRPLFGRSEIVAGKATMVQDCYNANPESMDAAMDFCDSVTWPGRRVYVLGSMRELGTESTAAHEALGRRAGASRADVLFFFGDETEVSATAAAAGGFRGRVSHHVDFVAFRSAVLAEAAPGDLILVKASRGLELERLAEALVASGPCGDGTARAGGPQDAA